MADTVFDQIVRGEMECYKVWEDDEHLAFLTPFPNTPGLTVVIPKNNMGDDVFALNVEAYEKLMAAVKTVAKILKKAMDVDRVALIFEGTGVAYVHAKLYPLHGLLGGQTDVWPSETDFTEEYRGYLTTFEGPKMDDDRLKEIQAKIQSVSL